MFDAEKSIHDIHRWPGISREDEIYKEETDRMEAEKGGEEYVTWEDTEEIVRRVRERLAQEGEASE